MDVNNVLREREKRYGSFTTHAETTQLLKNCIRNHLYKNNFTLAHDQQESLDMICLKIARILNGDPDYADNWVDIAGYATLVANRLNSSHVHPIKSE